MLYLDERSYEIPGKWSWLSTPKIPELRYSITQSPRICYKKEVSNLK